MSFVQPESNSTRRSVGIGIAIAFHVGLVWVLASGLGRQVMQVINAPIETVLIEEVKPPPPPPKVIEMPPPPKFTPPPPAYVPPPEVAVQPPPAPAPTIAVTVAEAPPPVVEAPRVQAPPAPPPPAPAPAPVVAPPPVSASVVCANYTQAMGDAVFPREAQRVGLDRGSALIQFTLAASGEVRDVRAVNASHPAFAKAAMKVVSEYRCKGTGRDTPVQVPFEYKSN